MFGIARTVMPGVPHHVTQPENRRAENRLHTAGGWQMFAFA